MVTVMVVMCWWWCFPCTTRPKGHFETYEIITITTHGSCRLYLERACSSVPSPTNNCPGCTAVVVIKGFGVACGETTPALLSLPRTTIPCVKDNKNQPAPSLPHHKHHARILQCHSSHSDAPIVPFPFVGLQSQYRPAAPYRRS